MIGETISHYRVLELLGAGGMGVVYKAEDTRLKRLVALKFLPHALTLDKEAKERLVHEAQAASALDHANICTIHEIDETPDGQLFLAMTYYEGETLKGRVARGALPIGEALDIIIQATSGVIGAHEAGIIHRDIKPANIVLTRRGEVKLLDFGVAKLTGQTVLTRTGTTLGTLAYMAPEQIEGQEADERSDVWALGVVLFEMLAGRTPFPGENDAAVIRSVLSDAPPKLRDFRADLPAGLETIIARALEKKPQARYGSAREFCQDLEATGSAHRSVTQPAGAAEPRPTDRRLVLAIAVALVVVTSLASWVAYRNVRVRRARQLLPEITDLIQKEEFMSAFRLLRRVEPYLADDPAFVKVRGEFLLPVSIRTEPPGADLYVKPYADVNGNWDHLGRSPLDTRGPLGFFRWRITKPGYTTFEGGNPLGADLSFALAPEGTVPDGMVRVAGGDVQIPTVGTVQIPPFSIDRYEVTNREFKTFVDAGGYRKADYWTEPFIKDGRQLSWDQAMAEFRDATGRPGPAPWELGTYAEGQEDYPVRGVSWYEAVAYARFAGKQLPTVHHWRLASAMGVYSDILELSNFNGKGPARVGAYQGIGPYGTYDMAGNVKEWCWNQVQGRRYILGGAWNEPNYQFTATDALSPLDRSANNGFRCIKVMDGLEPEPALRPIERLAREYGNERPVDQGLFQAYRSLYAYDPTDLKPVVESVDDSSPAWRRERISYAAAYGSERIVAHLFLPKNAAQSYQTVVYFPHSGGLVLRRFEQAEMAYLGFIVKAGRALLFPMYEGTYERRVLSGLSGPNAIRDLTVQQMKDLGRSVDYLQTRPDIDHDRLAYFGVSMGARLGSIALAVEKRFKAAVLWSGGFPLTPTRPEIDPINFAPRVTTPVLMLNGRDDFTFPIESSQLPMFRLLGPVEQDKRHVLYDGGHVFPFARVEKDTLDWLDRYLGVPR